jgi:hypothetical protein
MPTPQPSAEMHLTPVPLPPLPAGSEAGPDLPPARAGLRRARRARRLDLAFAGLVLAFAFLLASSPVRNSDFFQHAAAGRLLAQRQYAFGKDPFAFTTHDVYWANHAWLFDLSAYGLYRADPGGAALVVLKALLVTALAWLMLRVRAPGGARWLPPACAALAFLAMGPRLLFQPALVSYFLLGLAFWLLWRWQSGADRDPRRLLLLPALCALWVNLDGWFLLGPLLIGLVWLGGPGEGGRRLPAWVLPASLAACLLSPHHVRAFTLPPELSPALDGLRDDERFRGFYASPWQLGLSLPGGGFSPAQAAYFLLLGAGLVSFALAGKRLVTWRLAVWLPFAVLGAWQVRTVPFFAVVASPLTALNLQEFFLRRRAADPDRPAPGALAGRCALVLAGLALCASAWTGWAVGRGGEGRRVVFAVQPDPSLEHAARTLARWRAEGRLRAGERVFPFHPDAAHYLAWFCPGVRGFFDHRVQLFGGVAREYVGVCQDLDPSLAPGGNPARESSGWRKALGDRGVAYLLLYDPALRRLDPARRGLARLPEWEELHVDGQAVLFGWRAARPGEKAPFASLRVDPERLAFGPQGDAERWALPPAPDEGPPGPAAARAWRATLLDPARPAPWEESASAVYLRTFEDTTRARRDRALREGLARYAAGMAGLAPLAPAPVVAAALPVARFDEPPSPLPLLAVRAARRALADNPRDANAYLLLGEAYLSLARLTRESEAGPEPLAMLRHVQAVTALGRALALNPDLLPAHQALAVLYGDRQYLDLALGHRRAQLRLTERAGPAPGEDADSFRARLDSLRKLVDDLDRTVQDRGNQFVVRSAEIAENVPGKVLPQAVLARDLGLARKALEILLKSDVLLFGPPGARLQIELLLTTGRAEEARQYLDVEGMRETSGEKQGYFFYRVPPYEWLLACQSASAGDYREARASLRTACTRMRVEASATSGVASTSLPLAVAAEAGLRPLRQHLLFRMVARRSVGKLALWDREALAQLLAHSHSLRAELANLHVVLALLALEQGHPDDSLKDLDAAFAACGPGLHPDGTFAGRSLAHAYRERLRKEGRR